MIHPKKTISMSMATATTEKVVFFFFSLSFSLNVVKGFVPFDREIVNAWKRIDHSKCVKLDCVVCLSEQVFKREKGSGQKRERSSAGDVAQSVCEMCNCLKELDFAQYVELAKEKENEFNAFQNLPNNDGKFYFSRQTKPGSKPLEFKREKDGAHWYVPLKALNISNNDQFNRLKSNKEMESLEIIGDDNKIRLCLFFWFTEMYFVFDRKGLMKDQTKQYEAMVAEARKESSYYDKSNVRQITLF